MNKMRSSLSKSSINYMEDEEEDAEFEVIFENNGNTRSNTPNNQIDSSNDSSDQPLIIEKIMGRKYLPSNDGIVEEMFFIKWKGMSYLHVSWERPVDLEAVDPNAKAKLKRFLQSPQPRGILGESLEDENGENKEDEEELEDARGEDGEIQYFNPENVEVQRVIACSSPHSSHSKARKPSELLAKKSTLKRKQRNENNDMDDGDEEPDAEDDVKYLIKWRGLSYDECTWERWGDIKLYNNEVYLFWYLQKPPKLPLTQKPFPTLQEYKKLELSPVFGVSDIIKEDDTVQEELGLKLRDYQLEGVNWLLWNWWHKRSCILADEMGLGKTIQTISFLHQLRYMSTTKINGPFIIIAPLSLVDQWYSEISTWSPDFNCVLFHGNQEARDTIVKNEFYYQEPYVPRTEVQNLKKQQICKFHILLTTFEVAVKEIRKICSIPWQVLIVDEAHKLKNTNSRLFETLSTIESKHRVLLTGTPLQNKTEELWALLNFADAKRFHDMEDFLHKFGDLKNATQVASLHEMLKPYLLRRIKEDVEKSLPPKEETIVEVALTAVQKRFYRAIYEKNTSYLFKGLKASNQPSLMNVMMELRKCCNHPYLVRGVEERVLSEITPEEKDNENILNQKLIECSGKLVLLDKLLPRLFSQGHKVLIFSQMVRVLNLLEDFLKYKGYSFERLDGSSKSSDRKEAVERFCKPSYNRFIMLLSTKAGGLGLNLTAADTVIIYDSDWNPQNDLQAQARAHRIGQTKSVMVYRLLTRKTYEMEMFHQASMKLGLDRAVLAHARSEQGEANPNKKDNSKKDPEKLSAKEIDELLKRGAYDVFREDDNEQMEFVEADIESILQRRSHKVVYNEGLSTITSTLGSFSKASFVSADEKEDVDINDPDFWRKAIGLKEDNLGILNEAEALELLPQQRVRKQTKVFGNVESIDEAHLKLLLKPIKADKAEKSTLKAMQKEALLRERQEREEARKAKALEEIRSKNDPRNWGSHGRDRVLRALTMYGVGRWERIKLETGKNLMEISTLIAFSNLYVLQCGICAGEQESHRADSSFVKDSIAIAKETCEKMKSGVVSIEMPASLSEERFVAKLKLGLGRKTLQKLDALQRLTEIMTGIAQKAFEANGIPVDPSQDLDSMIAQLSIDEIISRLPLGDVRPAWARACPWWNLEADKHLVLGVFFHGFGRYDLIRDDERFLFKEKINQLNKAKEAAKETCDALSTVEDRIISDLDHAYHNAELCEITGEDGEIKTKDSNEDSKEKSDNFDKNEKTDIDEKEDADNDNLIVDDEQDENENENENDMDVDDDGPSSSGKTPNGGLNPYSMPDPRHLNRLFTWLVSSDTARLSKEEFVAKQKRERKPKAVTENPIKQKPQKEQSKSINPENFADESFIPMHETYLFHRLRECLDFESLVLVFKPQIQGLKKCEYILTLPIEYDNPGDQPEDVQINKSETTVSTSQSVVSSPRVSSGKESNMDVTDSNNDNNTTNNNTTTASTEITPQVTPKFISEYEAIRLSATFILFGVPIEGIDNSFNQGMKILKPLMGISSNESEVSRPFSWAKVLQYSKICNTEPNLILFYKNIWLQFCSNILKHKSFSLSQNKFLVPNPSVPPGDHHLAARGLCQLFALRQQIMHSIYYLVFYHLDLLLDYLRGSQGRNVDNMPVWWCPWIHDLGLFLGILKYGYLVLDPIFVDPELPFTPEYLSTFVRKVFLDGHSSMPPVARYEVNGSEEMDQFLKFSCSQYPEYKDLELRVIRILEDVTKPMPSDHLCRAFLTLQNFRNITSSGAANALDQDGNEILSGSNKLNDGKPKSDYRHNRSSARTPAMSLRQFVQVSRKRRKLYIASYHPECFPDC